MKNLKVKLSEGATKFAFVKKDGSVRIALGTTNLQIVPRDKHPKGNKASDKVVTFFDLEKQAWRSLSNETEFIFE